MKPSEKSRVSGFCGQSMPIVIVIVATVDAPNYMVVRSQKNHIFAVSKSYPNETFRSL